MDYYRFLYRAYLWELIGESPKQVVSTLDYYKNERGFDVDIPQASDISRSDANLRIAFPIDSQVQDLDIMLSQNVNLRLNANAFDYLTKLVRDFDHLRRGELYKVYSGLDWHFFLPKSIMYMLSEYNWNQHRSQVDQWIAKREDFLNKLAEKGKIIRRK